MKKIIIILLFITFIFSGSLFAEEFQFEREDETVDIEIVEKVGYLEEATGWIQTPAGEWVSRENRIPAADTDKDDLDGGFTGFGINNFEKIILEEIKIESEILYLMTIEYRTGSFEFPEIGQGWRTYSRYHYLVFEKEELRKVINLKKEREPQLFELKVKYELGYETTSKNNEEIKEEVNKIFEDRKSEKHLVLQIVPFYDEEILRFNFAISDIWFEHKGREYDILGEYYHMPINIPEAEDYSWPAVFASLKKLHPEFFHHFYFEVDIDKFNNLFPFAILE